MTGEKKYLFVGGTARSGTTAMATLLRAHPRIALGRERYAWRFRQGDAFNPSLFEKERFCNGFSPEDSHHPAPQPYYAELASRFDDCTWVGDKLPSLFERYDYVLRAFPGCRLIYMAREIIGVASSYESRARRSARELREDPAADRARLWPPSRDWRAALQEWNRAVAATAQLGASPQLLVVDYDRLFRDPSLLDELYRFLDLPADRAVLAAWRAGAEKRRSVEGARKPLLDPEALAELRAKAHLAQFAALLRRHAAVAL